MDIVSKKQREIFTQMDKTQAAILSIIRTLCNKVDGVVENVINLKDGRKAEVVSKGLGYLSGNVIRVDDVYFPLTDSEYIEWKKKFWENKKGA